MLASRVVASWDLLAAMAIAIAGAVASQALPGGSPARVVLALCALLLVPGYLLLQASLPGAPDARRRARDVLLAVGVSVPVIGVLALLGALWPNGFGAGGFVLGLLLGCLGLAFGAFVRRNLEPARPIVARTQPVRTLE